MHDQENNTFMSEHGLNLLDAECLVNKFLKNFSNIINDLHANQLVSECIGI